MTPIKMIPIIIPPRMTRTINQLIDPNSTSKVPGRTVLKMTDGGFVSNKLLLTLFEDRIIIEISWIWKLIISVKAFAIEKVSRLDSGFCTFKQCPTKVGMISFRYGVQIFEPLFVELGHIHFGMATIIKSVISGPEDLSLLYLGRI